MDQPGSQFFAGSGFTHNKDGSAGEPAEFHALPQDRLPCCASANQIISHNWRGNNLLNRFPPLQPRCNLRGVIWLLPADDVGCSGLQQRPRNTLRNYMPGTGNGENTSSHAVKAPKLLV
jgi:hypothetical protein